MNGATDQTLERLTSKRFDPSRQLYNLITDLGERKNFATENLKRVGEMEALLNQLQIIKSKALLLQLKKTNITG